MPVLSADADEARDRRAASDGGPGFGVYIHWPFCAAKCPYCDFNSHVRHDPPDQAQFLAAYLKELDFFAGRMPGRPVDSVFFGGGTPSLMQPETVATIIEAVARHWPLRPDAEITLEANPTSVEAGRFAGYAQAGVNRLSMGLQSLRDAELEKLGRLHSVAEARAAFTVAREHFARVSFDLIYARPGQTVSDWRAELAEALELAGDHLSLYQLTIEQGTPFYALEQAGRLRIPESDAARALYDATQELCEARGLPAYEISNHAAPGEECRHNLVYWRCGDYAGIGPGAHGRVGAEGARFATATEPLPERWRALVEDKGHGLIANEQLSLADQAEELLLMGLRLVEGIDPARYLKLAGKPLPADTCAMLEEIGLLEITAHGHIRATAGGRALLNRLIAELAA